MSTIVIPDPRTIQEDEADLGVGGPWVVILYNCDCHTFDEVVFQLQKATGCSVEKAVHIAREAEIRDRAVAYTGTQEECERVAAVLRSIRLQVETDLF